MLKRSFALSLIALLFTLIVPGVSYSQTNSPVTILPFPESPSEQFEILDEKHTRGVITYNITTTPFIIEAANPVPLIGGDGISSTITYARDPNTNTSIITNLDLDVRSRDGKTDVINSGGSAAISVNIRQGNIAARITDNMLVTSGGGSVNTAEFKGVNTSITFWVGNNSKLALEAGSAGGAALAVESEELISISGNTSAGEIYSLSDDSYAVNITGGGGSASITSLDVWTEGANSTAVKASDGVTISQSEIRSNGTDTSAVVVEGLAVIHNNTQVWATGTNSAAVVADTAKVAAASVWTQGDNSTTVIAETVNISTMGKVWARGVGASAVRAEDSGAVTITSSDGTGEIWTRGEGGSAVSSEESVTINGATLWAQTGNGKTAKAVAAGVVELLGGARVWAKGAGDVAVTGNGSGTVAVSSADGTGGIWAQGFRASAIKADTATVTGLKVWVKGGSGGNAVSSEESATIKGSDIWAATGAGKMANAMAAGTADLLGGSRVWANGAGDVAVTGNSSGTVAISSTDGTGEVWAEGARSSAVKANIATVTGLKVWANGADSNAISAQTSVTIENSTLWTEGLRTVAVDATVSGSGKKATVIVNSSNLSAVGQGTIFRLSGLRSGEVDFKLYNSVVGSDTAQGAFFGITEGLGGTVSVASENSSFWMGKDIARVFSAVVAGSGTATARIDNTVITSRMSFENIDSVWANGFRSSAIVFENQGASPADLGGHFNVRKAWTEGYRSATVRLETGSGPVAYTTAGKVWAEGEESSAVNVSSGGGAVFISSTEGDRAEFWTEGANSTTVIIRGGPSVIDGVKIWANGSSPSNAVSVDENITVNNSEVWAKGDFSTPFEIKAAAKDVTLNLHNSTIGFEHQLGAFFHAANIEGGTVTVASYNSSFWTGRSDWTLFSTTVQEDESFPGPNPEEITVFDGFIPLGDSSVITFEKTNAVWTTGENSSALAFNYAWLPVGQMAGYLPAKELGSTGAGSATITIYSNTALRLRAPSRIKVWSKGSESVTLRIDRAGAVGENGSFTVDDQTSGVRQRIWSEGANSTTVAAAPGINVKLSRGKVWANGYGSGAALASEISVTRGQASVWTEGDNSNTISAVTFVAASDPRVWSNGDFSTTAIARNVRIRGGSKVWSEGNTSVTVVSSEATVRGADTKVWANGEGSAAILAERFEITKSAELWTEGNSSVTASISGRFDMSEGSKMWSNGANSVTITGNSIHSRDLSSEVWAEGVNSVAISHYTSSSPGFFLPRRVSVYRVTAWANGRDGKAISSTDVYMNNVNASARVAEGVRAVAAHSANRTVPGDIVIARSVSMTVEDSTIWATGGASAIATEETSTVRLNVRGDTDVWTTGNNVNTMEVNASQPFGDIEVRLMGGPLRVWSNGANASAVEITTASQESFDVFFRSSGNSAKIFSEGENSSALSIKTHRPGGGYGYVAAVAVLEGGTEIYTEGVSGTALLAEINDGDLFRLNIRGNAAVFTNAADSGGVDASQNRGSIIFNMSANARIRTSAGNSTAIRAVAGGDDVNFFLNASDNSRIEAAGDLSSGIVSEMINGVTTVSLKGGAQVIAGLPDHGTTAGAIYANSADGNINIALANTSQVIMRGHSASDAIVAETENGDISFSMSEDSRLSVIPDRSSAFRGASSGSGNVAITVSGQAVVNASGNGAKAIIARADTGYANVIIEEGSAVYANGGAVISGTGISANTANGGAFVWVNGSVNVTGGVAIKMSAGAKVGTGTLGYDKREVTVGGTGKVYGDIDTSAVVGGASVTIAAGAVYDGTNITTTSSSSGRRSVSSGGDGRSRLGSAGTAEFVETEPEKSGGGSLNFGDSDGDTLTVNGTLVIRSGETINGLEKISFGANSTLVIMADPESVAGNPLIDLEGTITAEDVEGFNVEVEVPGAHVTEYTIFEAEALPDGEERQEVADRLSAEIGERISVETDENGNLFLRATSHKDTSLDVYDALIQSAYRSDRNFADKLARGCGISGAASDEIEGEFWTGGCVWATSGGRYTRHTSAIQYDEDVYSFTGGFSAPFSGVLVSIAGGYEISDIDASSETETAADTKGLGKASGDATRFMGGIFAEALVDEFVIDGNLRYGSTSWEATRTAGNSYSADVDATVFGGEIGAARPFLMGEFAFFPRVAVGASQITADKFVETSLTTGTDAAAAAMDAFGVDEISELLVYVSPSIEARSPLNETINMWIRTGADIQVLNPESEIEGRLARDNVPVDGTMDRVMFTYGAGFEYSPYEKFNVSFEYGGGVSSSVDTFVQQFRGGVNYRF